MGLLKRSVLGLSSKEAGFERRGFECPDWAVRNSLEEILRMFIYGYNAALASADLERLSQTLEETTDKHHVGFAFEGAGMCFALLDLLWPRKRSRLRTFTDGPGWRHDYIATVGAGFAVGRVPYGLRVLDLYLEKLDPMNAWCLLDGYGFHQGVFHSSVYVEQGLSPPVRLADYGKELFDSGLGRSLWWVKGASPRNLYESISRFPALRRKEMWHGVGVAATYAGGVNEETLLTLLALAGEHQADFLSGVPFAARMRQKGGNASPATDLACSRLLNLTCDAAANMLVQDLEYIKAEWRGSQKAFGKSGYMLVRDRLKQRFRMQKEERDAVSSSKPVAWR